MDGCSLFALIACFSWSNLYLDGGAYVQDADVQRTGYFTTVNRMPGVTETVLTPMSYTADENPFGRAALGYELRFTRVTLSAEAFIAGSLLDDGAEPVKGFGIKARWYPFR